MTTRLARTGTPVLSLLLAIWTVLAAAGETSDYVIHGKKQSFVTIDEKSLLISSSCLKKGGELRCQAFEILKSASFTKLHVSRAGGADPGAAVCKKLGGLVVVGLDTKNNEAGFCQLTDKTFVATDTLHFYALTNDRN